MGDWCASSRAAANSWVAEQLFAGLANPALNPHGFNADALAIAPSFGGTVADEIGDHGLIESITEILKRRSSLLLSGRHASSLSRSMTYKYGKNKI